MEGREKIRVGITQGDFNGIGLEVIIKTCLDNRMVELCTPVVYGSSRVASYHRKALGINDFSFNIIRNTEEINKKRANIINCWEGDVRIELGQSTSEGGKYALLSLERAVKDLKDNKIDVLVTAPVSKGNLQNDQLRFSGHTEYLTREFNSQTSLMMMISENFRMGLLTEHVALSKVFDFVTKENLSKKIQLMHDTLLKDFNIRKPKIAVLALNPHAGDNRLSGDEDENILKPVISDMAVRGMLVYGPYPADGFFGKAIHKQFDCVLAMYHDQGLIPFKTITFDSGVNFTAGLPIVRTSPDHGTAFDIAGKNLASEKSFREAIYAACDIFSKRNEYSDLTAQPLKVGTYKKEYAG